MGYTSVDRILVTVDMITSKAVQKMNQLTSHIMNAERRIKLFNRAAAAGLNPPRMNASSEAMKKFAVQLANAEDAQRKLKVQEQARNRFLDKVDAQQKIIERSRAQASMSEQRNMRQVEALQNKLDKQWNTHVKNKIAAARAMEKAEQNAMRAAEMKASRMENAMMGFGLSMLFTGMAIKRFADTAMRSVLNTFMQLADENNAALKEILHIQAAMNFLKFIIADTFMQSESFQKFTNFIVEASIAVANFIEEHPKLAEMIGIALLAASALGSLMMIIGQTTLGWLGLIKGMQLLQGSQILGTISNFTKGFASAFSDLFGWIKPVWNSFVGYFGTGLKAMGIHTNKSVSYMAGQFLGFATIGYIVGQLIYEPISKGIRKVVDFGSNHFYYFLKAVNDYMSEWGSRVSAIFEDIAFVIKNMFSSNPAKQFDVMLAKDRISNFAKGEWGLTSISDRVKAYQNEDKALQDTIDKVAGLALQYQELNNINTNNLTREELDKRNLQLALLMNEIDELGYTYEGALQAIDQTSAAFDSTAAKISTVLSTIGTVGLTGLLGGIGGGLMGGLGAAAGAGLAAIPRAIDDIGDISSSFEYEAFELSKESNEYLSKTSDSNDQILNEQKKQVGYMEKSVDLLSQIQQSIEGNKLLISSTGG